MSKWWFAVLVGVAGMLGSSSAFAHIKLKSPVSRDPNNEQKDAPCGPSGTLPRGSTMMVLAPGAKLTVMWDETVQHPGHYRIAFDTDGQDFPDPTGFEDIGTTGKELGSGVTILLDGIQDKTGPVIGMTPYTAEVTLPNIECENCTLQLIQVMTDKAPYGNGDDVYHECANIVLRRVAGAAGGGGAGAAAGSGGAAAGAGGAAAGSGGQGAAGAAAGSGAGGAAGMALVAGAPAGTAGGGGSGVAGSFAGSPAGGAGMIAPPATAGSLAVAGAAAPAPPATSDGGCSVSGPIGGADSGFGALASLAVLGWLAGSSWRRISSRRGRSRRG